MNQPELADARLMHDPLLSIAELVDDSDVVAIDDEIPVHHEPPASQVEVDGLDVLRAVVGAWRRLTDEPEA